MGNLLHHDFSQRYAAGKPSRSGGQWRALDRNINDLIAMAAPNVRVKIRQLVRDFPYFKRAKQIKGDWSVGTGIDLQARPLDRNLKYNSALAKEIEFAYKRFMDEADLAGRMHGKEIERLAKDQDIECGEFFILKCQDRDPKRFIPLALQMYEADWLTGTATRGVRPENRVVDGVEINSKSGKPMAYHFTDPDGYHSQRVEAKRVIHGFETKRPGQVRGISDFTSGVNITADLAEAMEGEVDGFKWASKWLAFVTSADPMMRQQSNAKKDVITHEKIEELENGIIEYLNLGESVELASNPRPSGNLAPFVRVVLLMISAATGVPYELLSMDYQGLNWAVIKVIRADFKQCMAPEAKRHTRQCCDPIYEAALESMVLKGRIKIPDYFSDPWRYKNCIWQPPVSEAVDRLRDSKADRDDVAALHRSPQEVISARGKQTEDVLDQIKEFKDMCEERGLDPVTMSTALANNPAKISKD